MFAALRRLRAESHDDCHRAPSVHRSRRGSHSRARRRPHQCGGRHDELLRGEPALPQDVRAALGQASRSTGETVDELIEAAGDEGRGGQERRQERLDGKHFLPSLPSLPPAIPAPLPLCPSPSCPSCPLLPLTALPMRSFSPGSSAAIPFGGVTVLADTPPRSSGAGPQVFTSRHRRMCVRPSDTVATDPSYRTSYIHASLAPHGLGDRWSFVNFDGTYHGQTADAVRRYAADTVSLSTSRADHGSGAQMPDPRKVFVDSDRIHAARHCSGTVVRRVFRALRPPLYFRFEYRHRTMPVPDRRIHVAQDVAANHHGRLAHSAAARRPIHQRR